MSKRKLFGAALIWLRCPALIGADALLVYLTVVDGSPAGALPIRSTMADDDGAVSNTMYALGVRVESKRCDWATKRRGHHD